MPVHNADIAAIFDEIADRPEIRGDNPFRIRAYRNAARSVGEYERDDVLGTRDLGALRALLKSGRQ